MSRDDIERVTEAARALAIPNDQRILHILPQDFVIDGQDGIRNPVGMSGVRLESKVHIITSAMSAAQNIVKCVRRCGRNADDVILEPLASSYAVLDSDEKELGVCLIDIGGGTTDIAVFTEGSIRHIAVLPVALAKKGLSRYYEKLGPTRYYVTVLLFLSMLSLPVKMLTRWLFNLKYIIAIPEWFFNI